MHDFQIEKIFTCGKVPTRPFCLDSSVLPAFRGVDEVDLDDCSMAKEEDDDEVGFGFDKPTRPATARAVALSFKLSRARAVRSKFWTPRDWARDP